jgi:thioredoxin reductase
MIKAGRKMSGQYDHYLAAIGSCPGASLMSGKTPKGIYLAGDAAHPRQKQAAIAFGDGIRRSMEAYEYLRNNSK